MCKFHIMSNVIMSFKVSVLTAEPMCALFALYYKEFTWDMVRYAKINNINLLLSFQIIMNHFCKAFLRNQTMLLKR